MKQAPVYLAGLFVILSIYRVGVFIQEVLAGGWLSWVFAIALAASVFVSGYFFRFKETKWSAMAGLVVFLPSDLFLNILELVRTTSAAQLVADGSHFMGIDAAYLTYLMQFGALLFGALQTFAAAVLGWMAAGAEKVQLLRARAFLPKLQAKILQAIDEFFPEKQAQRVYAAETTGGAKRKIVETNSTKRKRQPGARVHKSELTAEDKAKIADLNSTQIVSTYGGTLRRAEQWIAAARDGTL